MENVTKNVINDAKDKCVFCGAETEYMISTPINERKGYVEGAGQMCQKCYYEIYLKEQKR